MALSYGQTTLDIYTAGRTLCGWKRKELIGCHNAGNCRTQKRIIILNVYHDTNTNIYNISHEFFILQFWENLPHRLHIHLLFRC